MKRVFCLLGALLCVSVHADDPEARITFRVVDDFGNAVTGIPVKMVTAAGWVPGPDAGRTELNAASGSTDSNGLVTLRIMCKTGSIRHYGVSIPPTRGTPHYRMEFGKTVYYRDQGGEFRFSEVIDGRWQPWNPTVDIQVKAVLNPIPMYAKRVEFSDADRIPVQDKPVGYDFVCGDWVVPHGKGETPDVFFALHQEPEEVAVRYWGDQPRPYRRYGVSLVMSFPKDGDGLQSIYAVPHRGSMLRIPREAPESGYDTNLIKYVHNKGDASPHADKREDQNYFFRIRSERDDNGVVTNALYGKIQGDIELAPGGQVSFTYYLNPTPNDRNLEFDPAKNLLTGLSSREEVRDP